jgi:hypothetical protein
VAELVCGNRRYGTYGPNGTADCPLGLGGVPAGRRCTPDARRAATRSLSPAPGS